VVQGCVRTPRAARQFAHTREFANFFLQKIVHMFICSRARKMSAAPAATGAGQPHHHQQQQQQQQQQLIYDMVFDYYGSRLATTSSDNTIRILSPSPAAAGGWACASSFAAGAPTLRLAWAHPSQGAILAGACLDGSVAVWEEAAGGGGGGGTCWPQRALLGDARGRATAVAFAPRHAGLRLAVGSSDGHVRVYEAADAAASLAHWELVDDCDALPAALGGVACLAWSTSQFDAPLILVGGGGARGAAGVLKVRALACLP
jgi:hypothetical protein